MRRRRASDAGDQGVDLTPMLDVVFILLIFFIITATFVRERGFEIFNPDCSGCGSADVFIVVYVSAQNEVQIPDPLSGELRVIALSAVRANIERVRVNLPKSPVVIQPHPDSEIGVVVSVLDQVRQAGAPGVTIATEAQY